MSLWRKQYFKKERKEKNEDSKQKEKGMNEGGMYFVRLSTAH
jgi:hypothetical protein